MARTLIKTTTPGWYIDASDLDGNRVRKRDGDTIVTRDEFATSSIANGKRQTTTDVLKQAVADAGEPQVTVAETGKLLRGKTIQIKCSHPGCARVRTIKPQDAFQVKYCVPHQEEHRKEVRRRKQRAKAQARKAAAKS